MQITQTRPFRLITLQCRQIFFTDALTFISYYPTSKYSCRPLNWPFSSGIRIDVTLNGIVLAP